MEQGNLAAEQLHLLVEHGLAKLHPHRIIFSTLELEKHLEEKMQEGECWIFGDATIHDVDGQILVGQHLRQLTTMLLVNGPGKHAA